MYKTILIDDEPTIVEGLKVIIPWHEYGCEVVATAKDGVEGAQKIKAFKSDIVFTDIKMPKSDGLTMLAGLKSSFPNMQITVLTAYRDFEYAQTAIRLGVTRYLLKPSKMDEIFEAISAMTQNLKQAPPEENTCEEQSGSFIVRNVLKHLEAHYNEKLTLTEVAEKVYVSQWHLSKLLKKHTQKNFCDLLNQIRIKKAKELLRDPSLRINEIAFLVGFSDVAHFSKIFKKYEGMSANELRNSIAL